MARSTFWVARRAEVTARQAGNPLDGVERCGCGSRGGGRTRPTSLATVVCYNKQGAHAASTSRRSRTTPAPPRAPCPGLDGSHSCSGGSREPGSASSHTHTARQHAASV